MWATISSKTEAQTLSLATTSELLSLSKVEADQKQVLLGSLRGLVVLMAFGSDYGAPMLREPGWFNWLLGNSPNLDEGILRSLDWYYGAISIRGHFIEDMKHCLQTIDIITNGRFPDSYIAPPESVLFSTSWNSFYDSLRYFDRLRELHICALRIYELQLKGELKLIDRKAVANIVEGYEGIEVRWEGNICIVQMTYDQLTRSATYSHTKSEFREEAEFITLAPISSK